MPVPRLLKGSLCPLQRPVHAWCRETGNAKSRENGPMPTADGSTGAETMSSVYSAEAHRVTRFDIKAP
jgi:hypothetical protein